MSKFIKKSTQEVSKNSVSYFQINRLSGLRFTFHLVKVQSSPRNLGPCLYPKRISHSNFPNISNSLLASTRVDLNVQEVRSKKLFSIVRKDVVSFNNTYEKFGYKAEVFIKQSQYVFDYFNDNLGYRSLLTYYLYKRIMFDRRTFFVNLLAPHSDNVSYVSVGRITGSNARTLTRIWNIYEQRNTRGYHAICINRTNLPDYCNIIGSFTHSKFNHLLPIANYTVLFRKGNRLVHTILSDTEKLSHYERISSNLNKEPFVLKVIVGILFPDFALFMKNKGYIDRIDYNLFDVNNMLVKETASNSVDFDLKIGSVNPVMSDGASSSYIKNANILAKSSQGLGTLSDPDSVKDSLYSSDTMARISSDNSSTTNSKKKLLAKGTQNLYNIRIRSHEGHASRIAHTENFNRIIDKKISKAYMDRRENFSKLSDSEKVEYEVKFLEKIERLKASKLPPLTWHQRLSLVYISLLV